MQKRLTSFEEKALSTRAAWKFVNPLTVKIIGYEPDKHPVKVIMIIPGRPWQHMILGHRRASTIALQPPRHIDARPSGQQFALTMASLQGGQEAPEGFVRLDDPASFSLHILADTPKEAVHRLHQIATACLLVRS
jgi:hypothetical protein